MTRRSDERGIALILAVFALVVIGALVAGVFYMAELEQRTGTNTMSGQQATEAAQAGIDYAVANFSKSWMGAGNGNSFTIASTQLGSTGGYFSGSVTQLNGYTFLVRSFGTAQNGSGGVLATRTMGMLFKKFIPTLNVNAPVTVSGAVDVSGSSSLNGTDANPAGGSWGAACSGNTLVNQPGLRNDQTPTGHLGNISPAPSSNDTSVATTMADINAVFNALAASADINITSGPSVGPVVNQTTGACTEAGQPGNWGDPTNSLAWTGHAGVYPCASYFPIIYYHGSELAMGNATGQGVLLVDGDLRFNANFTFYGLIIVKGQVTKANGNSTVYGGLVAQNANALDLSTLNGNLTINYSSCAIKTAVAATANARPMSQRGFIQF